MWAARVVPDDAPLPAPAASALLDLDAARLAAVVGPDLLALETVSERLAFYEFPSAALALVDAAAAAGHLVPRQTACLAGSVLLQNGDVPGALAQFARFGLDDTRLLVDVAGELWGEQQHALAVEWATLAVRHGLAGDPEHEDEWLAEALTARHTVAARLGLLRDEGFCPRTTLPHPADPLEERVVARLLARPSPDLSDDEGDLSFDDSVVRAESLLWVTDALPWMARPIVVAFFPRHEWVEASRVWPDLTAYADSWDDHRGEVDLAASAADQRLHPVMIAPLTVDGLAAHAASRHRPVDARWVRDLYAFDLAVEQGRGMFWPPAPDAPCWCGEGIRYADCCATRVPPLVRAASQAAYEKSSRSF